MAPLTCDYEVPCSIPPARLFKAFILDDHFITKVLPQAIKKVEIVEGDGGVGSIKLITFGEGSQYKGAKQRVDGIDKDNFTYSYTILESDAFSDKIEKVANVIKIEASADGGSICKTTSTYYPKGNIEYTEEQIEGAKQQIKAAKERSSAMFKAVEAYLIANPDVCN
ncbi:major allergen Pru ar 1-like [Coffea eugenioides]|uniref:major allergen Pru ar 1-like n=1 Tax=Coffea eugenioides TaxID=49369 RepID=UPI000F608D70|nr:major allergen Pru ar 1-like [Coffea eugenioides]